MAAIPPHNPPFRADHVGSLLRPPELHKARQEFADDKMLNGDWGIVHTEPDKPFVIGDAPVVAKAAKIGIACSDAPGKVGEIATISAS